MARYEPPNAATTVSGTVCCRNKSKKIMNSTKYKHTDRKCSDHICVLM